MLNTVSAVSAMMALMSEVEVGAVRGGALHFALQQLQRLPAFSFRRLCVRFRLFWLVGAGT
jgi:hypothetical protein